MAVVTHFDKEYSCTTAIKGGDYVHLLNEDGKMIVAFDGVTDFSSFSITGGSWKTPTPENECCLAVVKDDGTMGKGGYKCSDVRTGTVAVANGGTGATDAATARSNLGAAAATHEHEYITKNAAKITTDVSGSSPLVTAELDGVTTWALSHSNTDSKYLKVHFYNSSGGWEEARVLLDEKNFAKHVTPAAIGSVAKSGSTMSGNLTIDRTSTTESASVTVANAKANFSLICLSDGKHGIWDNKKNALVLWAGTDNNWHLVGTADNVTGTVAVANGGTGAVSDAGAREALHVAARNTVNYNNIDNISESGLYTISGTAGLLIHLQWDVNYAYQLMTQYGNSILKYRYKGSGVWEEWVEVYSKKNLPSPADIGAAASSHNHSASNITSGTLSIARGGTGATTAAAARTNLGAAAEVHTHDRIENNYAAILATTSGTSTTLTARKDNKNVWAINMGSAGSMNVHHYDTDGNWQTSYELLDSNNFTTHVKPSTIGIVYSASQPSNPTTGMIWLKPV